ncbi:hypothetical protein M5689_009936 [Euphorbia peplus]|nr:hypothetical protein M5689_009936 [Euphorbia peplus]
MGIHKYSSSFEDEDYIDIEIFPSPNFIYYSFTSQLSPTKDLDFEFQMCPNFPLHKTSPADQFFFNGKLLPLSPFPTKHSVGNTDKCLTLVKESTEFNHYPPKKSSWSCKLKQFLLIQKLKSSTSNYLKSLFTKSYEPPEKQAVISSTGEDNFDDLQYMKISKKSPFGDFENCRFKLSNGLKKNNIQKVMAQKGQHSLMSLSSSSGSSPSPSCSSNSTFSMSSSKDMQLVKRSMNASNSEIEKSIEGAIAYCNKSYQQQQLMCSNEIEICSLPVSAFVSCGDH